MIQFYIAKFEKTLLIQTKKHDIPPSYWEDRNDKRHLSYRDDSGTIFNIYYTGAAAITDSYISLCLDFSKIKANVVFNKTYENNDLRDKAFDTFIKSIDYFKQHIDEYKNE